LSRRGVQMIIGVYGFSWNVNKSSINVLITTMNSRVAEASTCTLLIEQMYFLDFQGPSIVRRTLHLVRLIRFHADPSGSAVQGVGPRPFLSWDCVFESLRGHGCLSRVCCNLSCRGLCVWLICRPDQSWQVWCVWVWSWILGNEEALTH
jgi:hypothetical protein